MAFPVIPWLGGKRRLTATIGPALLEIPLAMWRCWLGARRCPSCEHRPRSRSSTATSSTFTAWCRTTSKSSSGSSSGPSAAAKFSNGCRSRRQKPSRTFSARHVSTICSTRRSADACRGRAGAPRQPRRQSICCASRSNSALRISGWPAPTLSGWTGRSASSATTGRIASFTSIRLIGKPKATACRSLGPNIPRWQRP